jgi:hypothetical protein
VPRLGELYSGICLTTEEKARKNLSQGSGTTRIHKPNSKNTQITILKHGKTSVRVVEQQEYINLTIKIHKLRH